MQRTFPGQPDDVAVPDSLRPLLAGRRFEVVWQNEVGGLTFAIAGRDGARTFVKWTPAGSGIDLAREVVRLRWAELWLPVPHVLDHGSDTDGEWVVTAGLPGESAVSARWISDPTTAVAAIGTGLRTMHETLPVEHCPVTWSNESRIAEACRTGLDPARWAEEHRHLSASDALEIVGSAPPIDQLVVCHGDACAPNTLLDADGTYTGHVDMGSLGVADRWADLAVATWSATRNFGPDCRSHCSPRTAWTTTRTGRLITGCCGISGRDKWGWMPRPSHNHVNRNSQMVLGESLDISEHSLLE